MLNIILVGLGGFMALLYVLLSVMAGVGTIYFIESLG